MRLAIAIGLTLGFFAGFFGAELFLPVPLERDYHAGFHDGVSAAIDYLRSPEARP